MSTKSTKGLGRGLEALIPTDFDNSILVDESERIQKLKLDEIQPNPRQPRKHFDKTALNELADSIKEHGLLQPLVVTVAENDKYSIIAGERRWRAAKIAGLDSVAAIVRSAEELEQLEIALVENVQRVDLSPLAVSIVRLHEQFSLGYDVIAKRLGKAQTTVVNIVRLLQLTKEAQDALQQQLITEGHARAIISFKDKKKQLELLDLIIKNKWTVRQAEQYVIVHKKGSKDTKTAAQRVQLTTTPETKQLASALKTKVTVRRTAKGGKIEINFKSDADLTRIAKKLLN